MACPWHAHGAETELTLMRRPWAASWHTMARASAPAAPASSSWPREQRAVRVAPPWRTVMSHSACGPASTCSAARAGASPAAEATAERTTSARPCAASVARRVTPCTCWRRASWGWISGWRCRHSAEAMPPHSRHQKSLSALARDAGVTLQPNGNGSVTVCSACSATQRPRHKVTLTQAGRSW